jgi:MFS transporter, DHA2 family, multidrug resistance protein
VDHRHASSAATASDSLPGATVVADGLPEPQAAALLTAAREAFTSGVHTVVAVGAAIFIAVALLTAKNLRHLPPYGQSRSPDRGAPDDEDERGSDTADIPTAE